MAIIWADNFDNYGTTVANMLDGIYAEAGVTLIADPDAGSSGNVIRLTRSTTDTGAPFLDISVLRKIYNSGLTTAGGSFRYYTPTLPNNNNQLVGFRLSDSNNVPHISVRLLTTGALEVTRGEYAPTNLSGTPGTIIGTSSAVITTSAWNHIEWKVVLSDTVGTVELRVNGVSVLSLTGQDTINAAAPGTIDQVSLTSGVTTGSQPVFDYFKDLILWDTTGTQNNDFLGTNHVYSLLPDADSTLTWTPSTGLTGFNLIDETDPNDADFISAADPPPAQSEFTLTNLPPDIVGVKALIPVVRARKIDGGDGSIQVGVKGTLTDLGADRPITSAFTYWWDVSELSPDTGVAWTPVEVDAVKLTINRTV